jgi:hypothetical protein
VYINHSKTIGKIYDDTLSWELLIAVQFSSKDFAC